MIPAPLLEGLRTRYAEPQRHYHNWLHIEAMLKHFRRWEDEFHRPEPVLWALYWHDAVYDPLAQDNEEQSAQLLEREASGHLTPKMSIKRDPIMADFSREIDVMYSSASPETTGQSLVH